MQDENLISQLETLILSFAPLRRGDTPLIFAAQLGRVDVLRVLLERGAPVDHANAAGQTALARAAERGKPPPADVPAAAKARWSASDEEDEIEAVDGPTVRRCRSMNTHRVHPAC